MVAMEEEASAVEPWALREVEEVDTVLVGHNSSEVRGAFVHHHAVLDPSLVVWRPRLDEVCPSAPRSRLNRTLSEAF